MSEEFRSMMPCEEIVGPGKTCGRRPTIRWCWSSTNPDAITGWDRKDFYICELHNESASCEGPKVLRNWSDNYVKRLNRR